MSQSSNTSRIKDAGRKPYNSLNVNHTFKPSKGESKSATGQNVRHGLQVLGKVGARRTPAPANLPSLKSENSGNDPSINLVPAGQGWGKKEIVAAAGKKREKQPTVVVPTQVKTVPSKSIDTHEISLRPNAGVVPSIKPQMQAAAATADTQEAAKMTWGNKVQQRQPAAGSSTYFHREFPKLGGGEGKGEDVKEEDRSEGNVPDANHVAMGHPEFIGRVQVPINMQPFSGERPIFNGAQMQYPYLYPIYPTHGGRMMPPYPYHYGYPGSGGKMQAIDPRLIRMTKSQVMAMPVNQSERPSIVKDSELRSLDDHKEDADNGWAGSHEEVDYTAKLRFDESDDSEDEVPPSSPNIKCGKIKGHPGPVEDDKNQNSQENWNDFTHGYSQQMMLAFANPQHWQRPPFPGYDPQRGPPPGPHGFPFHSIYPHPMFFQQNMQPQSNENTDEQCKPGDKTEPNASVCRLEEKRVDDKKELERKARLKKIEQDIKRRSEEEKQEHFDTVKKQITEDDDFHEMHRSNRSRNNSEASDSSRRSNTTNEIPPRFRRQVSNHDPCLGESEATNADNCLESESPHLTIMKRKDSIKSEDSLSKEDTFKKLDMPSEKGSIENIDERYHFEKLDQRTSRHSSSSSLYKEKIKVERQKRYSSSSDSHDKDRQSSHGSSSSIHKDNEKKEFVEKSFSKKELKDLSETRLRENGKSAKSKYDKSKRIPSEDDVDGPGKVGDTKKIDSGRFADLKLTKGQTKSVSVLKGDANFESEKKNEPVKTSPWSNVVSGKPPPNKVDRTNKSLRDIQLEEEENLKQKKTDLGKRFNDAELSNDEPYDSHTDQRCKRLSEENQFRSDGYDNRNICNPPYISNNNLDNRGYERRGRFDKRPYRKECDDGYRQNYNRYNANNNRYNKDENWNDRRGEYGNNRKDEYRNERIKGDYRSDRRDDRRDEHKNERKDDHKNDRRDEHKNERNDHKNDGREDHKNEKKEDQKTERKDHHKNDRRDDHRNERRDDRRNERKDDHKKEDHVHDRRDNYKGDRREDKNHGRHKDHNKDELKGWVEGKKEDHEKEDKGNESKKNDKRERYDKRENNRRDLNKKENYRKNDQKEDKRDEKKSNFREDRKREDRHGRREFGQRDGGRRYHDTKEYYNDDKTYELRRKKDEWSNRDYRQSEDYQKDLKAMQESKDMQESKKPADGEKENVTSDLVPENNEGTKTRFEKIEQEEGHTPQTVEKLEQEIKPMEYNLSGETITEGLQHEDTKKSKKSGKSNEILQLDGELEIGHEHKSLEIIDLNKDVEELHIVSEITESRDENIELKEEFSNSYPPPENVEDVQNNSANVDVKEFDSFEQVEDEGKPKHFGGFGIPDKSNKKSHRSESSNYRGESSYRGESNYRGGRERGRGRGRPYIRGSISSTRSRRSVGGGSRYRGSSSRDESRRREGELYEAISSGEFSDDSDTAKEKTKSNTNDVKDNRRHNQPPRFQNRYDSQESRGSRGRGRGFRSTERGRVRERGRGRGRGRGGSSHTIQTTHSINLPFPENKGGGGDEGDSDTYFSATDETIPPEEKDDANNIISSPNQLDRDAKPRSSRGTHRSTRIRGSSRNTRGSKNGSFLVNRQQVGNKRSSSKSEKVLSAADKSDLSTEVLVNGKLESHTRNQLNLEDISTHSPPKKSKNQIEKREDRKREIYKEFDLNNIASVVCIDDIKVGVEQTAITSLEEDGFVTVTSKKQQKEKRDREREEMKKKMLLEQKKEPSANSKTTKAARCSPKGTNVNIAKVKPISFTDVQISIPAAEQVPTSTAIITSPVSQQPSNNVAMATFGVWEPAQSLMRTSQQSNSSNSDMIKTSLSGTISTNINAWQRPLSLAATTDMSMPDPRAVGTGKPSSSHTSLLNKSNIVLSQPTLDAASPLITPPALAPIGSATLTSVSNGINAELAATVITADDRLADSPECNLKEDKCEPVENDFDNGIQEDAKQNEKRELKTSKRLNQVEKAPRFQARKENDDGTKNEDTRKPRPNRQSADEKRSQKRPLDRQRKGDIIKCGQDKKPIRNKDVEKSGVDDNIPIVFINEANNGVEKGTPKSTLSDADKVVGSNKPSLKTQSSLASFSSSTDNNIEEKVNISESYQSSLVENEISVEKEEEKMDGTNRSNINSLNDEKERSLETRSLPGTPPLAVKIPEPLPSGPSSDPGRGPSPPILDKSITTPSMNEEVNEMNRRLLNARRAWEDTPTTWSDTTVVSSVTTSDVPVTPVDSIATQAIIDESNIPGSPTKSESSVAPTIEVRQKSTEEKVSVSSGVFSSKRTEQQVCKVKPQQQLPPEEVKSYQTRHPHQLNSQRVNSNQTSKYASYGLPMERNSQQNTNNTVYTSESVYADHPHRSQNNQTLNFQSLATGRSMSTSVSPHSQQRDILLSSMQVGNMYSANTLQVSQSQFLAWQVTPTVQPTKTVPYQTYSQGSSFSSPVSIAGNSPVIMQYGTTSFPPQRSTSNMQRQHVNLMQLQQHQPTQGGRLVGVMPSRGGTHVRRNQQYQPLQSTSDGRVVNPNQMALMLEPNSVANMNHPQQLSGQQRSDLMKHVHAKPFEPTSQTPPLMQSPPVVPQQQQQQQQQQQPRQQQQQTRQQQQVGPSVFSQPASITHQQMQNIHHYSQPVMQQRQHGVQHIHHQTPLVASVRPRSIQEQNLSNISSSLPIVNQQDRINNNISSFNPFLANTVNYKGRNSTQRCNVHQVTVPQQAINNQFPQHALQAQRHVPSRSPTVPLNMMTGPGPIQRPQVHPQPAIAHEKTYVLDGTVSNDGAFKQTQRQKMLEDTKKYFEQEQKAILIEAEKIAEEKPVSSVAPNLAKHDLSKHDKVVLPNTKENGKKFDFKKGVRNGTGDFKNRAKRLLPKTTGGSTKKSSEVNPPQQNQKCMKSLIQEK